MNELMLFNKLFDDFGGACQMPSVNFKKVFASPNVDVKESDDSYTLEMDLPGRTESDVNVELNNNVLTISSETENETEKKSDKKDKAKWLIRERSISSFKRSFTLPDDVDSEKLSAVVKNGILTVAMPRKALAQPRKIAIASA